MPAGKSGHLELGYFVGTGKPGFIYFDAVPDRYDVMHQFATDVFSSDEELIEGLKMLSAGTPIYHRGNPNGKSVYIAGPMSGYPEFNFPAFFAAQKNFEDHGWKVWNPAAKDSESAVQADQSFATGDNKALVANGWDWVDAFEWDCSKVLRSDAIFLLPGWEKSTGARAEWAVAQFAKAQRPEYEIIYG
jgi:hypothetical protein